MKHLHASEKAAANRSLNEMTEVVGDMKHFYSVFTGGLVYWYVRLCVCLFIA